MKLIPIMGAVIALVLTFSYLIEDYQKRLDNNKSSLISIVKFSPPSILFVCLTILQLHIYAEISNEMKFFPFLYGIHIPIIFLIGPISYIFFEELSGQNFYKIRFLHYLPFVLSIFYLCFYKFNDFTMANLKIHNHELENSSDSILVLLGIGVLSIFVYILSILMRVVRWKLQSSGSIESSFRPFIFLLIYSLFVMILFVLAQWAYMELFIPACFGLTLLLFVIILLKLNDKGYLNRFKTEFLDARYKESRVKGIDVPYVLQRLDGLMNLERLYLNDQLTLVNVANRLDITSHQLSEILNTKLGSSFRNYINKFRLLEAAKLLLERREMTIIAIMYASGFNSKSSFHKLFQNRFGLSPQNYREKFKEKNI